MQQGETDWEDNIEVWVNCSHCGFQSSSRYYYDQYCEENNEDKKNTIVKQIKVKSLKNYLKIMLIEGTFIYWPEQCQYCSKSWTTDIVLVINHLWEN